MRAVAISTPSAKGSSGTDETSPPSTHGVAPRVTRPRSQEISQGIRARTDWPVTPSSAAGPASVLRRNATRDNPSSPSSSRGATTSEVRAAPLMAIIVAVALFNEAQVGRHRGGKRADGGAAVEEHPDCGRVPSCPCTTASTARSGRRIGSRMGSTVGETFAGKIAEGYGFDRQPRPSTQAPTTIARNIENARRSPTPADVRLTRGWNQRREQRRRMPSSSPMANEKAMEAAVPRPNFRLPAPPQ